MDNKRLLNFMLVWLVVMTGYLYIQRTFFPVPQPDPQAEVAQKGDAQDAAGGAAPGAPGAAAGGPAADHRTAPLQILTLGSVDPASPYRMLVQFTNRGAALERVELSNPRYRNLEDLTAYIGHLHLQADPQGLKVGVVGAGTPAAQAVTSGSNQSNPLRAGDVITQIGSTAVTKVEAYEEALRTYKPGDTVELTVERSGSDGTTQPVKLSLTAMRRPLEVIRPEPQDADDKSPHPASYLMRLQRLGKSGDLPVGQEEFTQFPSLVRSTWDVKPIGDDQRPGLEFRLAMSAEELAAAGAQGGGCEFVKRYWLDPLKAGDNDDPAAPGYELTMEFEVINRAQEPLELAYVIDGPNGLPLEGWWYSFKTHPVRWGGAGLRDIVLRTQGGPHEMVTNPSIVDHHESNAKNQTQKLMSLIRSDADSQVNYVGVDAQYFVSALMGPSQVPGGAGVGQFGVQDIRAEVIGDVDKLRETRTDVSFEMVSSPTVVQPGEDQKLVQQYRIFVGPKQRDLLLAYGLQECIVDGWFGFIVRPMTWLLHVLHRILFNNYGLAIIMLTVIVRGALLPFGRMQAQSAQKMQDLAPEMKKIAEQYKDDLEKRGLAQRELFRKHGYNPLNGCFLAFFQLPIFVGLYRTLSVDIELRQAALIPGVRWCSNLAGPDQLFYWGDILPQMLAGPTGWLGPYFNVLPLFSMALFLVQQKLFTPPPTDEQQEVQQKVMKFMTFFMGLLFFKVPAGLCIYFIASGLWSIGERKLLPKITDRFKTGGGNAASVPAAAKGTSSAADAGNAKSGATSSGKASASSASTSRPERASGTNAASNKPGLQLNPTAQKQLDAVRKLFGMSEKPPVESQEEMLKRRKSRKK